MSSLRQPDISIVTCSYNQKAFLETTILSVLRQKNVSFEYIVIDGASSDGSASVIDKYRSEIAYRVSEPDHGQSEALNKGLRHATGEIVGWLCSDDILLPATLQRIVELFKQHPDVDAIYGNAVLIDANGKVIRLKREIGFHPWLLCNDHNYIPQPAMFWRRKLHDQLGYLREDLHLTMDLELWLRFAKSQCKVLHVDEYLAAMRCHDSQKVFVQREALYMENTSLKAAYGSGWLNHVPQVFSRITRVTLKAIRGGYTSSVPEPIVKALHDLHIESKKIT